MNYQMKIPSLEDVIFEKMENRVALYISLAVSLVLLVKPTHQRYMMIGLERVNILEITE